MIKDLFSSMHCGIGICIVEAKTCCAVELVIAESNSGPSPIGSRAGYAFIVKEAKYIQVWSSKEHVRIEE